LRAGKTKRSRLVWGALGTLCLLVVFAALVVAPNAGNFLVCSETPQKADLILVLGGDFYGPRVLKGADLAVQGYAPLVLISGPPYQLDPHQQERPEGEFAIDFLATRGYPRRYFQAFGHHARSTISEAIVVCGELHRRNVHRVLLVTSAYHSRRADIVFRLFCPGIHFISVPAPDAHYDPSRWWSDRGSRTLFFSECKKIAGSVLVAYPQYLLTPSQNLNIR
jgi:uncharacterized SAM-binding protein YcdF (DUF218 family)